MDIHSLIETLKNLDESSRLGIQIPPELREILDRTNQAIDAFLQASQEEFDSKERDSSLEQMLLFPWIVFFKKVLEKMMNTIRILNYIIRRYLMENITEKRL